jgi:hypothetical protein
MFLNNNFYLFRVVPYKLIFVLHKDVLFHKLECLTLTNNLTLVQSLLGNSWNQPNLTCVPSGLPPNDFVRVALFPRLKHTSLLHESIHYTQEKFYKICSWPPVVSFTIFFPSSPKVGQNKLECLSLIFFR